MGRSKIVLQEENGYRVCASKKCIHNGKMQPISNFNKYHKDPSGIYRYCRDCTRTSFQKHYYDRPPIKQEDTMNAILELANQLPVPKVNNQSLLIRR